MRLKLPKSNLSWEVDTNDAHRYGTTRLTAKFTMPSGEQFCQSAMIHNHLLERDGGYGEHVVRDMCESIGREVGRRLVMG